MIFLFHKFELVQKKKMETILSDHSVIFRNLYFETEHEKNVFFPQLCVLVLNVKIEQLKLELAL